MSEQKVTPLILPTYLAVIKNSVGSNMFRNFYAQVNGRNQDIMKDGDLSCAFFTSSILAMFKLIEQIHGTVESTIKDLEQSGWTKINEPREGAVLVWETKADEAGESHSHIGFYIGGNQAVSNSSQNKTVSLHHWTYGKIDSPKFRRVEAIYWKNI